MTTTSSTIRPTTDDFWTEIEGPLGQPMDGWKPDEEVIRLTQELLTGLGNTSAEETDTMPDDETGAVLAFCVDQHDKAAVLVYVNSSLPSDLRVDLWGFCAGLAMSKEGFVKECGTGTVRVGTTRLPLHQRGADLLGALTVRRLGRNTVGCRFDVEPIDLGDDHAGVEADL